MNTLRLLLVFFRVSVLNETAYRVNFFVQMFQSLLQLGTTLAGLGVIFSYTNNLAGWRPDEMLALVGVFFLIGGLISLVIQPGMSGLIDAVRNGTLDFTLTKPEDAQLLVTIQRVAFFALIDFLLGLGVLIAALVRLGEKIGAGQAAAFIGMLLAGGVIVYSFWLFLASLSFWFVRVENLLEIFRSMYEAGRWPVSLYPGWLFLASLSFWFVRVENLLEIFRSMYEAGRWPVSLYPGWLRFGLTFIVPVAFATTIPTEALSGRLSSWTLLGAIGLAIITFILARLFWKIGLSHYSGASA